MIVTGKAPTLLIVENDLALQKQNDRPVTCRFTPFWSRPI